MTSTDPADRVMDIIRRALAGYTDDYKYQHEDGHTYVRWGQVETDIRAALADVQAHLTASRGEADELRHLLANERAAHAAIRERVGTLEAKLERAQMETADLRQQLREYGDA